MALIQCKECKAQISDSAASCPSCGAPPPKKTSFFTKFVVGSVFLMALMSFINSRNAEPIAASEAIKTATNANNGMNSPPPVTPTLDCSKDEAVIIDKVKRLIEQSPNVALQILKPCAIQTGSAVYGNLIATSEKQIKANNDAEIKQKLKDAKAAEIEAKATAKVKKSEGVSIGMTMEDAIASNWGKPRKINRTIHANTVREQWVYGNGYLYFTDGVLTSIQN
jgi:hypothetical protein